ncbi:aldehyde dehydrogenase family protein [Methanolobus halotolerans]|uniref:Aldehyde dehydrogenase family protein n=1 Tax=Methanolobus halotolerans TaxID=2052935 RepID=A0A4E0QR55_9EURY|nr:aldehyde dehydrogenase family protein [Methanolobus halotolerans]TGC08721.1 aldehyde dehydrogenase family protein [Methanolobus halotolerans]
MQPDIETIFRSQKDNCSKLALTCAKERMERLMRIDNYLKDRDNLEELFDALYKDLRKPDVEVLATEVGVIQTQITYLRKNLHRWLRDHKVPTPLPLAGTRSYIRYEPKGVVLIMSPWNFPLNLSLVPLVYAITAGNAVMLKPSEISSHTSAYIKKMMDHLFDWKEVAVIEGDASVASGLLELPFNHIFFTGSPEVGKIVMGKAAKYLSSLTLELGGKSPAIIDETANIPKMARRLAWAKSINCGQTCISPDYLIIHESVKEVFIHEFISSVREFYCQQDKGVDQSPDYCRIISDHHFQRLRHLFEDALGKGACVLYGGDFDRHGRFITPTLLGNVSEEMDILQEEIFGPLLPIITYNNRSRVNQIISGNPNPLMLYIASNNKDNIRYFMEKNPSGGTVINDYMLGYSNPELPFGGNNNSGVGRSLGFHCFMEFSNTRSVIQRKWGSLGLIYPPYTNRIGKLIKSMYRWM